MIVDDKHPQAYLPLFCLHVGHDGLSQAERICISVNTHTRPDRYRWINGLFHHHQVTAETGKRQCNLCAKLPLRHEKDPSPILHVHLQHRKLLRGGWLIMGRQVA